jgi:hypothetical protein
MAGLLWIVAVRVAFGIELAAEVHGLIAAAVRICLAVGMAVRRGAAAMVVVDW